MAIYEIMKNDETRYTIFAIDEAKDLDSLPTSKECGEGGLTTCCMGSLARGVAGKTYILNGKDMWVEYTGGGSGGGGGGGGDFVEVSNDEIDSLLD